jgi:hypothetical protein
MHSPALEGLNWFNRILLAEFIFQSSFEFNFIFYHATLIYRTWQYLDLEGAARGSSWRRAASSPSADRSAGQCS